MGFLSNIYVDTHFLNFKTAEQKVYERLFNNYLHLNKKSELKFSQHFF